MVAPPGQRLGLTPRQAEAVEAIRRLSAELGHAPSFAELAAALGCTRSSAGRLVANLRARGAVVSPKGSKRAVALAAPA